MRENVTYAEHNCGCFDAKTKELYRYKWPSTQRIAAASGRCGMLAHDLKQQGRRRSRPQSIIHSALDRCYRRVANS